MKRTGFRKQSLAEIKAKQAEKRATLAKVPKSPKKRTTGQITGNKRKLKTPLRKLKDKLWQLCREITIKRDGCDCYTCQSKDLSGSNRQLGHFISSSICSTELRYCLDNLRIQCYSCNINKSGNWLTFEKRLRQDKGEDFVENLKKRNEQTKGGMYREDWYEAKIAEYQRILESL